MADGARSATTISVLGLLLVVAAVWGWTAATEPLPGKVDTPLCVDETVSTGARVFPQDVTVSVYNAGTRDGLAGRTMKLFEDAGFAAGSGGNVTSRDRVTDVEIWTTDRDNPAVLLVASYLGRSVVVERRDPPGVGVAVVVGDGFRDLVKGRRSIVAEDDAEVCSPPVV